MAKRVDESRAGGGFARFLDHLAVGRCVLGIGAAFPSDARTRASAALGFAIMGVGMIVLAQTARAQSETSPVTPRGAAAEIGCYRGDPPATLNAPENVRENPNILIISNPAGGAGLSTEVRNLVVSSPSFIALALGVLRESNVQQQHAIVAGLGQAALLCQTLTPAVAQDIQDAIAGLDNAGLEATFRFVTGDTATAAITTGAIGAVGFAGGGGPIGTLSTGSTNSNGADIATPQRPATPALPFAPLVPQFGGGPALLRSVSP